MPDREPSNRQRARELRSEYACWKHANVDDDARWFPVFHGFKDQYLATLSGGAVKLYLYFGLVSRHESGESWHSIDTIAAFFDKSPRTVNEWVRELVEAGLVVRHQLELDSESHTYLRPYDSVPHSIGDRIHAVRTKRGVSLKELSERSGVAVDLISRLENNTQPNPTIKPITAIAQALSVSANYLLGYTDWETRLDANGTAPPTDTPTEVRFHRHDFGGVGID